VSIWVVAILVGLVILLRVFGLWGSHGGFVALLRGQSGPAFEIPRDAVIAPTPGKPVSVRIVIESNDPIHRVSPEYLSVAIDLSQVTGGKWWDPEAGRTELGTGSVESPVFDFDRPELDRLVAPLSPMWLRIGGSESDKIYYDLDESDRSSDQVPRGFESVLTAGQWDALNAFARRNDLRVIVTLNAGPAVRDGHGGPWGTEQARDLIRYTAERGYPVELWELGNEVNNFWYVYGPRNRVSARRYAEDARAAAALIAEEQPGAGFAGQGAMIWPILGEPLGLLYGMSFRALRRAGEVQDVVTWHFYPQQGRRGPIASRRAHPLRLLEPANLDEIRHWAGRFRRSRDRWAPQAQLWLGETGNAQFGGEPGLSDVYLGGLWWLDQLGVLAQERHDVVVRQSLTGQNYGLLDDQGLAPRPDYWNSLAWKSFMGTEVLLPRVEASEGTRRGDAHKVRVYVHRTGTGALTILAINLHHDRAAEIALPVAGTRSTEDATTADGAHGATPRVYAFDTRDIFTRELRLNGRVLALDGTGAPPEIAALGRPLEGDTLHLPPLGYAFVVVQ